MAHDKLVELFGDKKACFLAAYRGYVEKLVANVTEPVRRAPRCREGMHGALAAFLMFLADNPSNARACLVEGFAAGPEVDEIRDRAMRNLARFLDSLQRNALPDAEPVPLLSEATIGGIYQTVATRIRGNQASSLPGLAKPLSYFLLAPVGHEAALREVGLPTSDRGRPPDR